MVSISCMKKGLPLFYCWRAWMVLTALMLGNQCVSAQSQPPFRIGLNFPFAGPSNSTISSILASNVAPLGLRGMRHMAPGDVTWYSLQPHSNAPPDFSMADLIFFNTNNIQLLGTFYYVSSDTNAVGLQVPWNVGSGGFNFTSNESPVRIGSQRWCRRRFRPMANRQHSPLSRMRWSERHWP